MPRILVGTETDEFPSVGIVGSVQRGGFCTGTLISPWHVLTAAHCAEVIEAADAGTFELGDQVYVTSAVIIHPDFNTFTLANDIALLELNEPVLDVEPSVIFRDEPVVGDILEIVGYGGTGTAEDGSDGSFGVKRVGLTTIDEVTPQLISWLYDDATESNTASGDSGGPGYLTVDGESFIACITSGGTEPDSVLGDFAFNTRIDAYADWIDTAMNSSDSPDDDEPSDTPADDGGDGADDGFWSQPFPFIQFLIDLFTWIVDYLNAELDEGVVEAPPEEAGPGDSPTAPGGDAPAPETPGDEQPGGGGGAPGETPGDEPGETPGDQPGETPGEQPEETPGDQPEETPTETPVDCPPTTDPIDEPTDPIDEPTDPIDGPTEPIDEPTEPIDEPTEPIDEPTEPIEEPTEPIDEPTDPIDVPDLPIDIPDLPIDVPTDPIDVPSLPTEPPTIPGVEIPGTPPGGVGGFGLSRIGTAAPITTWFNRWRIGPRPASSANLLEEYERYRTLSRN